MGGACLRVRNRIDARVFDRHWIAAHMPDAELRRQQVAFRRGLVPSGFVAAMIVAVIAGLAITAMQQARQANEQRRLVEGQQPTRAANSTSIR